MSLSSITIIHPTDVLRPMPGHSSASAGCVSKRAHLGVGVAFMLLRAPGTQLAGTASPKISSLVTIGTVADMVPLTGENRTLVMYGLKVSAAVAALVPSKHFADLSAQQGSKFKQHGHWCFVNCPRINASGRMDDPIIALNALRRRRGRIAKLDELNTHRRSFTAIYSIKPAQHSICRSRSSFWLMKIHSRALSD